MIIYSVLEETLHNRASRIRYFLHKEDADAFKEDHTSEIALFPKYHTEAILVEEVYNRKGVKTK